jgi:hypothetical protein
MSVIRIFCVTGVLLMSACGGLGTGSVEQASNSVGAAQVCQPGAPDPRACDPADAKKTTICHIPPGNPANAHTLCVGNAAVPAHLAHGDFLGSCCGAADGGTTTPTPIPTPIPNPPPPPAPLDGGTPPATSPIP